MTIASRVCVFERERRGRRDAQNLGKEGVRMVDGEAHGESAVGEEVGA